jgi:hypothetical protein
LWVSDRAGLDRKEPKAPLSVGRHAAKATEAGRQRHLARIFWVRIPAVRIGLPDLHEGVGHRLAIAIEHAPPNLKMLTRATWTCHAVDAEPREADLQVGANRL